MRPRAPWRSAADPQPAFSAPAGASSIAFRWRWRSSPRRRLGPCTIARPPCRPSPRRRDSRVSRLYRSTGASSACIGYVRSECVRMLLVGAPDAPSVVEDIMSANVRIALALVAAVSASGLSASGQQPVTEASTVRRRRPCSAGSGRSSSAGGDEVARAQPFFDQGLRLLYAFNHAEALRAFREARAARSGLAMAHWGQAMALAATSTRRCRGKRSAGLRRPGQRAPGLGPRAGPNERALIDALALRFAADGTAPRRRSIRAAPTR